MASDNQNPCTYKPICKTCKWVEAVEDRPALCIRLSCEHYTPCAKCGKNAPLYKDKKCSACSKEKEASKVAPPEPYTEVSAANLPDVASRFNGNAIEREISFTVPGQCPPEYNDEERAYYENQWEEYQGYFRDPSAYPIVHSIILMEIELSHINTRIINSGSEDAIVNLEKRRLKLVETMDRLRRSLPERESLELSDDEKAIAAIYERYAEERLRRRIGGVSRVLTPEAIALAPRLPYKLNLSSILLKLGYRAIDIEAALQLVIPPDQLPKDPVLLLEALGIFLREKVVPLELIQSGTPGVFPEEKEEVDVNQDRFDQLPD